MNARGTRLEQAADILANSLVGSDFKTEGELMAKAGTVAEAFAFDQANVLSIEGLRRPRTDAELQRVVDAAAQIARELRDAVIVRLRATRNLTR